MKNGQKTCSIKKKGFEKTKTIELKNKNKKSGNKWTLAIKKSCINSYIFQS